MRTQPCDAPRPSEPMSPVPWKPTEPLKPIHRSLSGLFAAPPGTVVPARSPAQSESGTFQAGSTCLDCTVNLPTGVGYFGSPTATLYVVVSLPSLKTRAV